MALAKEFKVDTDWSVQSVEVTTEGTIQSNLNTKG